MRTAAWTWKARAGGLALALFACGSTMDAAAIAWTGPVADERLGAQMPQSSGQTDGAVSHEGSAFAASRAASRAPKPGDPGSEPWPAVARDDVAAECGLDPDALEAAQPEMSTTPFAIFRYGKLCWSGGGAAATESYEVMSVTKTFSAVVLGIIASRTELDETDLVRDWLDESEMGLVNRDATVAHMLAMTSTSLFLDKGLKNKFVYDALGVREVNLLAKIMDRAVQGEPDAFPGLTTAVQVAQRELIVPLGMTATSWPGEIFSGLKSSVLDMGRLGQLLLRKGRWDGRQVLDADYVYRMTHPSFEDSNTAYGYLTWMNGGEGADSTGGDGLDPVCSPFSTWQRYPHPTTFENNRGDFGVPDEPSTYDVGLFWAVGAGGQFMYVHRALDLVITTRTGGESESNSSQAGLTLPELESPVIGEPQPTGRIWRLMRPALVALDPVYKGDEAAFCAAYRDSAYAPSLLSPWETDSGFGPADDAEPAQTR